MADDLIYEKIVKDENKLLEQAVIYWNEAEDDYRSNLEPRIIENYQHFHFTCDALQERAALDEGGRSSLYISDLYQIAETRADQTSKRLRSVDPPIKVSPVNANEPGADEGARFQQRLYMAALKELHDGGQGISWDTRLKEHLWDIEIFPYGILKAQIEKRLTMKASYRGAYPSYRNGVRYRLPSFYAVPIWHFRKDPLARSQADARYDHELWMLSFEEIRVRYPNLSADQLEEIKDRGGKNGYDIYFDRLRATTGRPTTQTKISKYLVVQTSCVFFDENGFEHVHLVEFIPGVAGANTVGAGGGFLLEHYDSPHVGMRLLHKESKARPVPHEYEGYSTFDIGKPGQMALLALRNAALDNADYFNIPMVEVDLDLVDPDWVRERKFSWEYAGVVEKRGQGKAVDPIFVPGNNLSAVTSLILQMREHLQALTAGEEILQGSNQSNQDKTFGQSAQRERNANIRLGESTAQSIESTMVWLAHFFRSAFIDFLGVPGDAGLSFSSPGSNLLLAEARLNPRLLLTDIRVDVPGLSGYDNMEIKKAASLARLNILTKLFAQNMPAVVEITRQWLEGDETVSEDDRNKIIQAIESGVAQNLAAAQDALAASGRQPGGNGQGQPTDGMNGAPKRSMVRTR